MKPMNLNLSHLFVYDVWVLLNTAHAQQMSAQACLCEST